MPSTDRRVPKRHEQCRVVVAPPSTPDTALGPDFKGPPVPLGFGRAQTLEEEYRLFFDARVPLDFFFAFLVEPGAALPY